MCKLPEGYQDRPANMDDLEAAVALFNACSRDELGVDTATVEDNRLEWLTPGFDLSRDTRLVIAPHGQLVGYCEVWDQGDPHVSTQVWGRVHPDFTRQGIGSYLLTWAETRSRECLLQAPAQARCVMLGFTMTRNRDAGNLFLENGFQFIRHSLRMRIEMESPPPQPVWPSGVTVHTLVVDQDERSTYQAVREAFKDHWGHVERPFDEGFARWQHFWKNREDFDPTLMFLAVAGDQVAGISLCEPKVDDDPEMGWVGTLGVLRPWRRQGLGTALLLHSFGEFYRRGISKAGLGVDAESLTGATRLYTNAGMHSEPSKQWSLYEKELRPGVELRTLSAE